MKARVPTKLPTSSAVSVEAKSPGSIDLSIIIPALNEGPNLVLLLPQVRAEVRGLELSSEILIVARETDPQTTAAAEAVGAVVLKQQAPGIRRRIVDSFSRRSRGLLADHGRRSLA